MVAREERSVSVATPQSALIQRSRPAEWRSSVAENVVVLGAFFLTLVWPVYLVFGIGRTNVSPPRLLSATAIALVLLYTIMFPERLRRMGRILSRNVLLFGLFAAWIAWRFVADSKGLNPSHAFGLSILDVVANCSFVFTLTAVAARSVRPIVETIFWADLILIVLGLIEYFAGYSISTMLTPFSSLTPDQLVVYAYDSMRGDIFRVKALSSHAILFGTFVASMIPLLISLRRSGRLLFIRLACYPMLVATPIVLFASLARSALVVAMISLAVYYGLNMLRAGRRSPAFLFAMALAAILLIGVAAATSVASGGLAAFNSLVAGRNKLEQQSTDSRVLQFHRGMAGLAERSVFGFGDGEAANIAGLRGTRNALSIDSYFLAIALNSGVVGFVLNLAFLLCTLAVGTAVSIRPSLDDDQRHFAALTAASLSMLASAITVTSSEYFAVIYALAASAAVARARQRVGPPRLSLS